MYNESCLYPSFRWCDTVSSDVWFLMFWRIIGHHAWISFPCRWWQYDPVLTHWYGITCQKMCILTVISVSSSSPCAVGCCHWQNYCCSSCWYIFCPPPNSYYVSWYYQSLLFTDECTSDYLKNNIKIYIKIAVTCFGAVTPSSGSALSVLAKVTLVKIVNYGS